MLRPQASITLQTRSVLRSGASDGPGPAGPAARVESFPETARFAAPRARRNGPVLWGPISTLNAQARPAFRAMTAKPGSGGRYHGGAPVDPVGAGGLGFQPRGRQILARVLRYSPHAGSWINDRRVARMDGMRKQKARRTSASHRASVSFPSELYETLEGITRQKRVCRWRGWCVTRYP